MLNVNLNSASFQSLLIHVAIIIFLFFSSNSNTQIKVKDDSFQTTVISQQDFIKKFPSSVPKPVLKTKKNIVKSDKKILPKLKKDKHVSPNVSKKKDVKKKVAAKKPSQKKLKINTEQKEKMLSNALEAESRKRDLLRYEALAVGKSIKSAISSNWIIPTITNANISCKVRIKLDSKGNVLDVFVTKSSGSYSFDRSAKAAVITASPLPMPKTSALIRDFQTINLTLSPDD